ncbi:uncharacterized protein LOC116352799 isoform X2 [Oncorhynchus kisutch]|uniref:uncharacterized protein LOC116352799 isoform X2 n=1 Tax=Oncorhynchus kisutch TaxID=8019 RepID=UPI0012DF7A1E|nr:uncharacterized protein LOC116352799 isoform X2 [Oncorhynchus kisutch]
MVHFSASLEVAPWLGYSGIFTHDWTGLLDTLVQVSKTCQQSSLEQGDMPSSFWRLTKLEIQILLNDVKHSINHMQGTLNTMQGQCIELQTAMSKFITAADVAVQRKEILRASGLIPEQKELILLMASITAQRKGIVPMSSVPAHREGILLTASVPVKNGNNHPQPPPIIPMVAPLWKWDGGPIVQDYEEKLALFLGLTHKQDQA